MAEISVIIPVYNVENYLAECLDSVFNQTFKDYEVIIVNDGSTDNSLDIIKTYEPKFKNIKIINQHNQGLSAARNAGVAASSGKYLFFLDSDDYLVPETLSLLYNACVDNNADLGICGIEMFWENGRKKDFLYNKNVKLSHNPKDLIPYLLTGNILGCCCNKLYLKSTWCKNNLSFPNGRFYEDYTISIIVLSLFKKISIVDKGLYRYRMRDNSIVSTPTERRIVDLTYAVNENIRLVSNIDQSYEKLLNIYRIIQKSYIYSLYNLLETPSKELLDFIDEKIGEISIWEFICSLKITIRAKVKFLYYFLLIRYKYR